MFALRIDEMTNALGKGKLSFFERALLVAVLPVANLLEELISGGVDDHQTVVGGVGDY